MRKTIKKALRIKGMKFYISPIDITYGIDWNVLTKVKTKKRMKELIESNLFVNEVMQINTNFKDNYCVIYRTRKG